MGLGRMGGRIPWVADEARWVKEVRLSSGKNWSDVRETRMIGSEGSISKGDDVWGQATAVLQISCACWSGGSRDSLLINHVGILDRKRPAKEQE